MCPFGQSGTQNRLKRSGSCHSDNRTQSPRITQMATTAICRSQSESLRIDHLSVSGHLYFVVIPKPANYLPFVYRSGKMCFACMAIIDYAKSSPESVPVTLWRRTPALFTRSPGLGTPDTRVGGGTRGTVACHALRLRHPPGLIFPLPPCPNIPLALLYPTNVLEYFTTA